MTTTRFAGIHGFRAAVRSTAEASAAAATPARRAPTAEASVVAVGFQEGDPRIQSDHPQLAGCSMVRCSFAAYTAVILLAVAGPSRAQQPFQIEETTID